MKKTAAILLILNFLGLVLYSQDRPQNAILKNFKPFENPRTNGRPGEVYRISEDGIKYIVEDIKTIKEKVSEEGTLVGRMYFTANELLSLLNLEFDRLEVIPAEVKIVNAKREYNEQVDVDKVLYEGEKIRDIVVDDNSSYYIIRESILSKDVTFRFSPEVVNKIKRGSTALVKIKSKEEVDFPYEIQKKFKKEKRIFYLNQTIQFDPYDI